MQKLQTTECKERGNKNSNGRDNEDVFIYLLVTIIKAQLSEMPNTITAD